MGLTINENGGTSMARVTVDRRLWLDADGKLVEDGDPKAAFLWAGEGATVDERDAEQVGYRPKAKPQPRNKAKTARTDKGGK